LTVATAAADVEDSLLLSIWMLWRQMVASLVQVFVLHPEKE